MWYFILQVPKNKNRKHETCSQTYSTDYKKEKKNTEKNVIWKMKLIFVYKCIQNILNLLKSMQLTVNMIIRMWSFSNIFFSNITATNIKNNHIKFQMIELQSNEMNQIKLWTE